MSHLHLPAIKHTFTAQVEVPGSKSIANRVLLLAALATGVSTIHNVPKVSEDVTLMLDALRQLGVEIKELTQHAYYASYQITGCAGQFKVREGTIFCGNSGTTLRFLTATLALMQGNYVLSGTKRMHERPIADLVDSLRQIGAQIDYAQNSDCPPLIIQPLNYNHATTINISGSTSSQYLSALLMGFAASKYSIDLCLTNNLISEPYVAMTVKLLELFSGREVQRINSMQYQLEADYLLRGIDYSVEPDASAASYFFALGALNGSIEINGLNINSLQGDVNFVKILEQMGAKLSYNSSSIRVSHVSQLHAIKHINMQKMPDVAMTLAVLALFAQGTTTIDGIESWKVKETDRLIAMQRELSKLGAVVDITNSSISITPPAVVNENIAIDTYDDHRMAMSFALVAAAGVGIIINDYECVNKTFANYFAVWQQACCN